MKHLVVMVMLIMSVVAGYIGWRMSDDAIQVLTGVIIGAVFIGVPGWVMAFMANRTRELELRDFAARMAERGRDSGKRPPLVLVQGGSVAQQRDQAGWMPPPQLGDGYGNAYGGFQGQYDENAERGSGIVREFGEL